MMEANTIYHLVVPLDKSNSKKDQRAGKDLDRDAKATAVAYDGGMMGAYAEKMRENEGKTDKTGISIAGNIGLPGGNLGKGLLLVANGGSFTDKHAKPQAVTLKDIGDVINHFRTNGGQEERVLAQKMMAMKP